MCIPGRETSLKRTWQDDQIDIILQRLLLHILGTGAAGGAGGVESYLDTVQYSPYSKWLPGTNLQDSTASSNP